MRRTHDRHESPASPASSARGNFTPPSRESEPPSPQPSAPAPGSRFSPLNWRVPAKLNAILLIPVLVGLVMGGVQVKGSIDTWRDAEDAESTAVLVRSALAYSNAIVNERDVSAAPLLRGDRDDPAVARARAATDRAAEEFDRVARKMPDKPGLKRRLDAFHEVEPNLSNLRAIGYTSRLPGVKTEEGYVAVHHPLMEFANELGLGTGNITAYGRSVYAISLTQSAVSLQRSIGMHMLVKPGPDNDDLVIQRTSLGSYAYLEAVAAVEYTSGAIPEDVRRWNEAQRKLKTDAEAKARRDSAEARSKGEKYVPPPDAEKMVGLLASLPNTSAGAREDLAQEGVTQRTWWDSNTARFEAYRDIETSLADKAVKEASGIADDARRDTFLTAAAVLLALLAAFVLAGFVARQMSLSMSRLRSAAFGIAEQRLPMMVDQLSRTDPGRVDTRVEPIPISSQDEIGEVARAFDQVHREAVRLASEQALLRGNINAIFTNLSRRNQSLIEGQLTLITDLENNEADPDQLQNLFRLDHLATRMRRNGENLLVLAGEEPGRRWDQPVPLVDVLRAASSEVEQYERIELAGVPDADVHGLAVTDLVHLLAELLENATSFSSPQTKVRVAATRLSDGRVLIEIHDKGIGLTADDFVDLNHKLANPPTVDVAISQRMGLFVVGRLADRHGIRVQLRPSGEQAGTTSLVMLPEEITHGGGGEPAAEPDFTVSAIIPEGRSEEPAHTAEPAFKSEGHSPDVPPEPSPAAAPTVREEPAPALGSPLQQPGGDGQFYAGIPEQSPDLQPYEHQQAYDQHPYEDAQPYAEPQSYEEPYAPDRTYPEDPYYASQPYDEAAQAPQYGAYEQYAPADDGRPPLDEVTYAQAGGADLLGGEQTYRDHRPEPAQSEWRQSDGDAATGLAEGEQLTESGPGPAAAELDGVGFDLQSSAAGGSLNGHELTEAGLPRRGTTPGADPGDGLPWPEPGQATLPHSEDRPAEHDGESGTTPEHTDSAVGTGDPGPEDWRSANDDRWHRAEQLRQPRAGGVTSSGLPRRVPKANLIEGAAEQTPQGGPQISRAPEDVRGRLSRLRRGIQQGRTAGSDPNGQAAPDRTGGPDSSYDQER